MELVTSQCSKLNVGLTFKRIGNISILLKNKKKQILFAKRFDIRHVMTSLYHWFLYQILFSKQKLIHGLVKQLDYYVMETVMKKKRFAFVWRFNTIFLAIFCYKNNENWRP